MLVGVDESPGSRAALEVAARLALGLGARLIVVHSVGLTARLEGDIVPANQHLDDLARRLHDDWTTPLGAYGDALTWEAVLEWGPPPEVLLRLAAQHGAAIIVVGSRRHRETGPELLGSTSHHVVHHSRRPVVVVPAPDTQED